MLAGPFSYLFGMSRTVVTEITGQTSISLAFERIAAAYARRPAFIGKGGLGSAYTYAEVSDLVRALAAGLAGEPYRHRNEVALVSENRPEWPVAYLAVLAAGKTVVPIDPNLKPKELSYVLEHADIGLVFCSGRFEQTLLQLRTGLTVFSFEENSPHSWTRLGTAAVPWENTSFARTAALIYTSGTTGIPKAVELTHRNLLSNVEGARQALGLDEQDVFISVLPLHHTFEATCGFLTPLLSGASIVYVRSLKSREILEDIGRNGGTVMCGVPLLYEKMYRSINRGLQAAPAARRMLFHLLFGLSALGWRLGRKWGRKLFRRLRQKAGLDSIRMFVSGGAAIPPRIARFFNLVGFDFLQGYGMTECSPVISVNRPDNIRFGSVGPPLPNVEIRIDRPVAGGVGEILVRGPNVSPGYRGNPEQTAELIRGGWLHSGDLGRMKGGHLWITGRAKNLIVSAAGKNIYPEEIEERLAESRYVLEALVFGRDREGKQGEEVHALIVPDMEQFTAEFGFVDGHPDVENIEFVLKGVVGEINRHMADFKRISNFHVQLEELEKTSARKIKRFMYR